MLRKPATVCVFVVVIGAFLLFARSSKTFYFSGCYRSQATPVVNDSRQNGQTLVEVWCGGDDNLTQGVCRALDREFASSPDFVVGSEEKPGTLIVRIP